MEQTRPRHHFLLPLRRSSGDGTRRSLGALARRLMLRCPLEKLLLPYCCQSPDTNNRPLYFLWDLQVKKRADERTRTADLLQLRVIGRVLQRFA